MRPGWWTVSPPPSVSQTAVSPRPALIVLSLSVHWGGGVVGRGGRLCGATMATGPFNASGQTVTNDLPEPVTHTVVHGSTRLSMVEADWSERTLPLCLLFPP